MTSVSQGTVNPARRRAGAALKKTLFALTAVWTVAAGAADPVLLKLTPAEYSAVVSFDLRRAMENRALREVVESPEIKGKVSIGEDSGLRVSDLSEAAVFHWDECWYGVFRLRSADRLRETLEKRAADNSGKVAKTKIAGAAVYILKQPGRKNPRRSNKELCVAFIDDGLVVLAKAAELEKFLKARRADVKTVSRLAGNPAEAWFLYIRRSGASPDDFSGIFDSRLKQIALDIKLTGQDKSALELVGKADFSDGDSAKSMSMTVPGLAAILTGLVFSDDPEGGDKMVKALRCEVQGSSIRLSMRVDKEMLDRFFKGVKTFFVDDAKFTDISRKDGIVK